MLYYQRLKRYLVSLCCLYENPFDVTDEDKRDLEIQKNWFVLKNAVRKNDGVEIERNFISLLSLLEFSGSESILQFYGKLDYLNKKYKKEEEAMNKSH